MSTQDRQTDRNNLPIKLDQFAIRIHTTTEMSQSENPAFQCKTVKIMIRTTSFHD